MNQSIIFNDTVRLDGEGGQLMLIAQCQGMRIECVLTFARLGELTGKAVTAQNALPLLQEVRFDVEELAEALIEDDAFDERGRVYL